jgi:orotidine-5'-phosphate decarboxylase
MIATKTGVKFKDADLIGIPFRVTVGPKALARGAVELKPRRAAQAEEMPLADAVGRLTAMVREGSRLSVYSLLGAPQLGQMHTRLIFALDVATVPEALQLVQLLRNEVGMFKVGKQLFLHAGPEIVREIKEQGGEVFLDLKFHDIPRTVAKAGAEATRLGVRMFDLHASGSVAMMRQTIVEVNKVCRTEHLVRPKLLAVTVLTSLDHDDLRRVGVRSGVESQVVRLARLAREAGMDGVVASPHDGTHPGMRSRFLVSRQVCVPEGSWQDQKRVWLRSRDPCRADYLVAGSPSATLRTPLPPRSFVAAMGAAS